MDRPARTPDALAAPLGLSWPVIVSLLALAGTLGYVHSELLADPDTYWHIAAGRWILEHRSVPIADPFSHSMLGAPWTAHEWLAEVVLAVAYGAGGWGGVVALAVVCFAATLGYLTRFLLRRLEPVHALALAALTASLLAVHFVARPHVLTWPLLAILTGTLADAVEHRRGPPWWLPALLVPWANLHGGVTLALVLVAVFALEAVLGAPQGSKRQVATRWAAFGAVCAAATMATPWGWKSTGFTFHLLGPDVMLEAIDEWRPTDFGRLQPLGIWLLVILGLALSGRLRLPWTRLLLVLALVQMALGAVRQGAVLGLVSPFLIARNLGEGLRTKTTSGADAELLDRMFRALAVPARPAAVVIALIVAAGITVLAAMSGRYRPPERITPADAVSAALAAGARGNVLNDYGFGGYLIFRGIPVFIDGRADMYRRRFMERAIDASRSPTALPAVLEEYRIGWTLLQPDTPAVAALDAMPCWRRVHADDNAVVHVRISCAKED